MARKIREEIISELLSDPEALLQKRPFTRGATLSCSVNGILSQMKKVDINATMRARLPGLRKKAEKLLGVLYRECAVKDPAVSDGQLLHGVYCRKSPTNDARDRGVDECNTWGDYFYVEALKRVVTPGWKAYW